MSDPCAGTYCLWELNQGNWEIVDDPCDHPTCACIDRQGLMNPSRRIEVLDSTGKPIDNIEYLLSSRDDILTKKITVRVPHDVFKARAQALLKRIDPRSGAYKIVEDALKRLDCSKNGDREPMPCLSTVTSDPDGL